MKKVIFARIADMKYYKGVNDDQPYNGGSYINENGHGGEVYNFCAVENYEGKQFCLGYVQLIGNSKNKEIQLHIERIPGCNALKNEEKIDDVIVVFCSKARGCQNMRVVGFYKHATVYRNYQHEYIGEEAEQYFNFIANKEDCILLPYKERHCNNDWYVPLSGKNKSTFGFGHSNIWFGGNNRENDKEIEFVERMIKNIENYDGENWIDRGGNTYEF